MGGIFSKSKKEEIQDIKRELQFVLVNYKTKYIELVNRINSKNDCILLRKEESVLFNKMDFLITELKIIDNNEYFDYFMNFYEHFLNLKKSRYFKVDMEYNMKVIDHMIYSPLLVNPDEK
jgi:hypothetical protein